MDPVAKTAFYCCGVRMLDAESPRPLCGDQLAGRFMDAAALELFKPFRVDRGPNMSTAARHRIIDDMLRERLQREPTLNIVLLGAGFDTRAFRLSGGNWLELDQASIVNLKEAVLPARDAPNPLRRVAIDFARDSLHEILRTQAVSGPTVVVMEGVSMYLHRAEWQSTTNALHAVWPSHTLICDLITDKFVRRYGRGLRKRIAALGSQFGDLFDDPASVVTALGYELKSKTSMMALAVAHMGHALPIFLMNTLFRSMRDGYQVYVFDARS